MRGIEEIRDLCSLQGLDPSPDLSEVTRVLAEPLRRYQELELRIAAHRPGAPAPPDAGRIDLVTLHEDPAVIEDFLGLLARRGAGPQAVARARSLVRFGTGHVLGMKLPVAGTATGGEVYVRGALPFGEVGYLLARHGVPRAEMQRLRAVGRRLDKAHLHMLATDAGESPTFTCFLTTYLEPAPATDEGELEEVFHLLGLDAAWDTAEALHRLVGSARPETLFLSLQFADGTLQPRIKLDYVAVRLGLLMQVAADYGSPEATGDILEWGRILGTMHASYVGLLYGPEGFAGARAYFTRGRQEPAA